MMACILVLDKIYGRFACTQDDLMKRITSGMSSVPIGRRRLFDTMYAIYLTGGYCWSFNFHATRLLLLRCIRKVFGPSMTAYARHYVGHFEEDQQYPGGF